MIATFTPAPGLDAASVSAAVVAAAVAVALLAWVGAARVRRVRVERTTRPPWSLDTDIDIDIDIAELLLLEASTEAEADCVRYGAAGDDGDDAGGGAAVLRDARSRRRAASRYCVAACCMSARRLVLDAARGPLEGGMTDLSASRAGRLPLGVASSLLAASAAWLVGGGLPALLAPPLVPLAGRCMPSEWEPLTPGPVWLPCSKSGSSPRVGVEVRRGAAAALLVLLTHGRFTRWPGAGLGLSLPGTAVAALELLLLLVLKEPC